MKHINTIVFSLVLSLFVGAAVMAMPTSVLAQTYNNQYNQQPEPNRVQPMSPVVVVNRVQPGSPAVVSNTVANRDTVTSNVETTDSGNSGFGIFASSNKGSKALAISNIQVTSGPRNITNPVSGANCGVSVSWNTTVPSVGQVVYGPVSQQDPATFQYAEAAVEGTSRATSHSVALPSCLGAQQAYYFRIVAFTSTEYKVSSEQTILPLPIEVPGVVPTTNTIIENAGAAGASLFSTLGNLVASPISIIVVIVIIVYLVVRKLWLVSNPPSAGAHGGHGDSGHGEEETLDEPILSIPHH